MQVDGGSPANNWTRTVTFNTLNVHPRLGKNPGLIVCVKESSVTWWISEINPSSLEQNERLKNDNFRSYQYFKTQDSKISESMS